MSSEQEHGGKTLLDLHGGSVPQAVTAILDHHHHHAHTDQVVGVSVPGEQYHGVEQARHHDAGDAGDGGGQQMHGMNGWRPWLFAKTPARYWRDVHNQRLFLSYPHTLPFIGHSTAFFFFVTWQVRRRSDGLHFHDGLAQHKRERHCAAWYATILLHHVLLPVSSHSHVTKNEKSRLTVMVCRRWRTAKATWRVGGTVSAGSVAVSLVAVVALPDTAPGHPGSGVITPSGPAPEIISPPGVITPAGPAASVVLRGGGAPHRTLGHQAQRVAARLVPAAGLSGALLVHQKAGPVPCPTPGLSGARHAAPRAPSCSYPCHPTFFGLSLTQVSPLSEVFFL